MSLKTIFESELITVIIPVYNVEKYLSECIDSVLVQTYSNLEIFLVDDGSTDNSSKICDEYSRKDKRIKVIHKENEGQGVARNLALDKMTGTYVSFVDSDDYIDNDMYELMLTTMKRVKADMVICGSSVLTFGRRINKMKINEMQIWDNEEIIKKYLSTEDINNSLCNKLYRQDLFDNIRMPEMRAKEDAYVMPVLLSKCKKAAHVGTSKYVQRVRMESTERSNFSEVKLSSIDCAQHLQNHIKELYPIYYHYIETELAARITGLMIDIIRSFKYREFKNLYFKLYLELKEEVDNNINNNSIKWLKYKNIINNHFIFLMKYRIIGIQLLIKNMLRNMYNKMLENSTSKKMKKHW